ncbi:MAG TPA: hypothetical protein VHR36_00960 [Pyrinomonadaceae bacterium]|jgi:hypothetical protein|nr:hypothetical protein [Pyrinomonadaceae bacterium]
MQESSGRKTETPNREADATSKDTVADLDENEKSSGATEGERESDVHSPDGAFDEKKETDDAGPM